MDKVNKTNNRVDGFLTISLIIIIATTLITIEKRTNSTSKMNQVTNDTFSRMGNRNDTTFLIRRYEK